MNTTPPSITSGGPFAAGQSGKRLGRRIAISGLSVLLATSLYACAAAQADDAEPEATPVPSAATVPGEAHAEQMPGRSAPGPSPTDDVVETDEQEKGPAGQDPPPPEDGPLVETRARDGRPAVVRGSGTGEEMRSTRAAVALDAVASPSAGVDVRIKELRTVESTGEAPGYRYGDAVVLVITVHNRTEATLTTLASDVLVEYGRDKRPADPSPQAGDSPLPDEISPGETGTGTYTFLVPADGRGNLSVTVAYRPIDPAVVLEGPVRPIGPGR